MKNTNIDWCPQIPSEWTEVRIKDVALLKSGDTFNPNSLMDGDKYQVYGGNGVRGFTNLFNNIGKHVIIGRQGALCGNINYADGNFFATEHAVVVYPYIIKEPIHWLGETLRSANYNRLSTAAAQPGLAVSVLSNQFIPYPPYKERVAIANYLDSKCSKIDASVATLKEMKDKYLSLKKSLINETVCRGLNKNVPLKSSGIDWIGDIPEHWEVKRMKSLFEEKKDLSETGKEDLLSVSEYYGVAKRVDKMTDDDIYESRADTLVGYKLCQKGDLVVNIMLAWKKGLGISDFNGIVSPAYAVFKSKKLEPHYYHYLLRSDKYISEFRRHSKGIIDSRWRLYPERFYNIIAITPPISEQQSIAKYLDDKCSKIDSIIANIDSQIEAYTKLKKSLISEVVTGKKRVI